MTEFMWPPTESTPHLCERVSDGAIMTFAFTNTVCIDTSQHMCSNCGQRWPVKPANRFGQSHAKAHASSTSKHPSVISPTKLTTLVQKKVEIANARHKALKSATKSNEVQKRKSTIWKSFYQKRSRTHLRQDGSASTATATTTATTPVVLSSTSVDDDTQQMEDMPTGETVKPAVCIGHKLLRIGEDAAEFGINWPWSMPHNFGTVNTSGVAHSKWCEERKYQVPHGVSVNQSCSVLDTHPEVIRCQITRSRPDEDAPYDGVKQKYLTMHQAGLRYLFHRKERQKVRLSEMN